MILRFKPECRGYIMRHIVRVVQAKKLNFASGGYPTFTNVTDTYLEISVRLIDRDQERILTNYFSQRVEFKGIG